MMSIRTPLCARLCALLVAVLSAAPPLPADVYEQSGDGAFCSLLQQDARARPKCGFFVDCPRDYDLAEVNSTAASQAEVNGTPAATQAEELQVDAEPHQSVHDAARAACAAGTGHKNTQILPDGGWCLSKERSRVALAEKDGVDADFVVPQFHVFADPVLVSVLAKHVLPREDGSCCHSLTDLGAGVGQIGHALRSRFPQLEYHGYDGAGNVEEFTQGYVSFADLTKPLRIKRSDWVISSEVGEHIPHRFERQVIANLHAANCRGIVLTWAALGQMGKGHINCHSNAYLISLFEELGYRYNATLASLLRRQRVKNGWLSFSSMAFDRIAKPPACN